MTTIKKTSIIISVGLILFLTSLFSKEIGICSVTRISCFQFFDQVAETLLIFIPLFILSLITYKMREEIFKAWLKFAFVWVPLTIILTLIAPEYDSSLLPITKGVVSFWMSGIFLVISFIIIIIKSHSSKK